MCPEAFDETNAKELESYPIPLESGRVHDDLNANVLATAGSDDLAIIPGTYGLNRPVVRTSDAKAATVGQKVRYTFIVPDAFQAGRGAARIVANAGMTTTIADDSATIDVQCVRRAAPTVDIVQDAAQSINSLTAADYVFDLDASDLQPGDELDIIVTITITDAATGTAVLGTLNSLEFQCDTQF